VSRIANSSILTFCHMTAYKLAAALRLMLTYFELTMNIFNRFMLYYAVAGS